MQIIMAQNWSLQEFVEIMGIAPASLEEATVVPVTKATLGNTAMKVGHLLICVCN
jgi:hypothetical protein